MVRVTTPIHRFKFPEDPSTYSKIIVTYVQGGKVVLEKKQNDMTFNSAEKTAQYKLTQSETKSFTPGKPVSVQARVLTSQSDAMASSEFILNVADVLNEDILT